MTASTLPRRERKGIPTALIDPDAIKIVRRLNQRGHSAYLVGGCVRDLLLGKEPKDFDICTSALPEEVRALFRNCMIVGRRFRLAHIRLGEKIIEVATFRRAQNNDDSLPEDDNGQAATEPTNGEVDLLIRSDNLFGTEEDDAQRRDFTINGLFYDVDKRTVIDYVGGLDHLEKGEIWCIGDPTIRFQEDPVRMLRAVKFSARLKFPIAPCAFDSIFNLSQEIKKAAPARLLEEVIRLLRGGASRQSFRLLDDLGLLQVILPEMYAFLTSGPARHHDDVAAFWGTLEVLDQLWPTDPYHRALSNSVIFASLFYRLARNCLLRKGGNLDQRASLLSPTKDVVSRFCESLYLPRRVQEEIGLLIHIQSKLAHPPKRAKDIRLMVRRSYFPDALELLRILRRAEGKMLDVCHWWEEAAAICSNGEPAIALLRKHMGVTAPPLEKGGPSGQVLDCGEA